MGMSVGDNKGAMSEPNIVPLIDVLLVLIIIFMVITPRTPTGLSTIVPQPSPPDAKQNTTSDTIVVQVENDGKVMINQDQYTWDTLGPQLTKIFEIRADKIAFVKGDDNVDFAQMARAIDIMRGSGIDHVGLITAKIEAGQ
jgi:biopolymer transport protein TolR